MFKRWLLALVARVGLIVLGLSCCLSLFYLLACKPSSRSSQQSLLWSGGATSKEGYMALLQEREDTHRHYINSLARQIAQLKEALQERTQQLQESLDKAKTKGILPQGLESLHKTPSQSDLKELFRSQLNQAEVNSGVKLPSEYAVIPFDTFTLRRVYQLETGLTRHPEERPARKDHRDELIGTVETALHVLNGPHQHTENIRRKRTYSPSDFVEGLTRTERDRGTVYELVFKGDNPQDFTQLVLFRPFGPMMKVKSESVDTRSMLINIIVPLSKRRTHSDSSSTTSEDPLPLVRRGVEEIVGTEHCTGGVHPTGRQSSSHCCLLRARSDRPSESHTGPDQSVIDFQFSTKPFA
ncbi:hypothetical protein INR49_032391, partial [Caranx melampygus]